MEKRILGIILAILGVAGLVASAVLFMKGGDGGRHVRSIVVFALLGLIFFFSGVKLVRATGE
jgi:hypothetical protein